MLASFASVAQGAATARQADLVLLDVGPNLGAINRAAMVACDHVVVPCRPTSTRSRDCATWARPFAPGAGNGPTARPAPAKCGCLRVGCSRRGTSCCNTACASTGWSAPTTAGSGGCRPSTGGPCSTSPIRIHQRRPTIPHCLGLMKHYHSLVPMAQEARRPIFLLRSADGAIGAHQQAVQAAYHHFAELALRILDAVGLRQLVPQ